MRRLLLVLSLAAAAPAAASAQAPPAVVPPDPQPITLSVQEYQALLNMAIQRDPLASLLLQKEAEAQAKAQKAQEPKK
jgi:hypothetical protein